MESKSDYSKHVSFNVVSWHLPSLSLPSSSTLHSNTSITTILSSFGDFLWNCDAGEKHVSWLDGTKITRPSFSMISVCICYDESLVWCLVCHGVLKAWKTTKSAKQNEIVLTREPAISSIWVHVRLKIALLMTVRIGKLIMTEFECLRLGMITFKRDLESTRTL